MEILIAFAMKWGEGISGAIKVFHFFCLKTIYNHFPSAKTRFAHNLSFILRNYSSWRDYEHGWIW